MSEWTNRSQERGDHSAPILHLREPATATCLGCGAPSCTEALRLCQDCQWKLHKPTDCICPTRRAVNKRCTIHGTNFVSFWVGGGWIFGYVEEDYSI